VAAGRRCRPGHRCPIPWFRGRIHDQDGYEAVAAGEALEDGAMLGMKFFVQGAIGTLW